MPIFCGRRWRSGWIFGTGPRVPMDRERRSQFKAKLNLQRRPGRLTIATAAIGRVLVDMLGADGRLDPALETIAVKARVSVATVKRALAQLRDCGFVTWTRRLIHDAAGGWRTEQATNAYCLAVPACEDHSAPAVRKKDFVMVPAMAQPSLEDLAVAQAVLARRREVVAVRLLSRGSADRCQRRAGTVHQ